MMQELPYFETNLMCLNLLFVSSSSLRLLTTVNPLTEIIEIGIEFRSSRTQIYQSLPCILNRFIV